MDPRALAAALMGQQGRPMAPQAQSPMPMEHDDQGKIEMSLQDLIALLGQRQGMR